MPTMTDMQTVLPDWDHYHSDLAQILGEGLDEVSWQAFLGLPAFLAPELLWRLLALHDQLPTSQATPIYFHAIRTPPTPAAQEQICGLCGGALPQSLAAQATQRFRCELCAIAARLLLGYPLLYPGSLEALPTQESSLTSAS